MLIRKAALLLLAAAAALSLQLIPAATLAPSRFVTLPYHATHAGSGHLQLQVLDPEDHILTQSERPAQAADGDSSFQTPLPSGDRTPLEDLVWQRVHYRFTYDDGGAPIEGTEALSRVLRRPVLRILGQSTYLAGSRAATRVIVLDAANDTPPETGNLRIELLPQQGPAQPLYTGPLNRRGTLEAQFRLPAAVTGQARLRYVADTSIGSTEYTQDITLEDRSSILLTTEKPIYQPGQTIHIRALALDRAAHRAQAGQPLTFSLEDARGNKIFRAATTTDRFGIASTEVPLADEVNLGAWHLHAALGENCSADLTLNVERYVLPKFKVSVEFAQQKRSYRPGDHVTGTLHANYFFGKPVDHAEVEIKASALDVAVFEAAKTTGRTDAEGAYHFDLTLPAFFAGRPLSQGAARALVEASVTDSAAHAETRGEPITISQTPLILTAIPESGTLIPRLENRVYLLLAYPDGAPAPAASLTFDNQRLTTDAAGLAVALLTPDGDTAWSVQADDHHGQQAILPVTLSARPDAPDQILLRPTRTIVKTGDRLELHLLSTRRSGTAYVDLIHNGQTLLTRDVDLHNGEATVLIPATPEMSGTLDANAYLIARDAQPIADHRLLFVQPADELRIQTTTDAQVYRPGAEARIRFHVTDANGRGVSAALGLQIVDEAVFALAEKQPGFAKVFFYLEQEALKPRYEIHSLTLAGTIDREPTSDLAAPALFSATELAAPKALDVETGRALPQQRRADFDQRYRDAFQQQTGRIATQMKSDPDATPHTQLDPWGTPLRIEPTAFTYLDSRYYKVTSAGPNHTFSDDDDLSLYLEDRTGAVLDQPDRARNTLAIIEHDRGPFNGAAQITGTLTDASGATLPHATVELQDANGPTRRQATTNAQGSYRFAGVHPAHYRITFAYPGFESSNHGLTVQARDFATLNAALQYGVIADAVEFNAAGEFPRMAIPAPFRAKAAAPAPPMVLARTVDRDNQAIAYLPAKPATTPSPASGPAPTHVRSYFPEALYINPEIVTDAHGEASITIPVADSITTWRMATLASTPAGALGTGAASLKVFQDFFVDLDLPTTLTQGDSVTLPTAVYNYTGQQGSVALTLAPDPWYTLEGSPERRLDADSGKASPASYTLTANRIGHFKLTLAAHLQSGNQRRDDIVVREIEVVPNGRENNLVFNGRFDRTAHHAVTLPANTIAESTTLFVRLYPGPLSQVVEGMDALLQMPHGCFEQTSSSTYPNILALDYMKQTRKLTPEIHAKAEFFIATGYQRLLTFEVHGGGFSWFGEQPANKILTAYGLMEFNDMSKVAEVDPRLIERTRDWLLAQQQQDGSWKATVSEIHDGATDRFDSDTLRNTAYIAWALANTGYRGEPLARARQYIETHATQKSDPYTLAVIANFAADFNSDRAFTAHAMQALVEARKEAAETVFWPSQETAVYSTGNSASIETTGLATQALLKWGQAPALVRKALNYIATSKQADGTWGTTQATITSLRALLLATTQGAADVRGTAEVLLNGKLMETLKLTPENNDLFHQFVFHQVDAHQANDVQLRFSGTGTLAYQVDARYFTPWQDRPAKEPLSIDVTYDRTQLAETEIATATARIRNNQTKTANMVMVDLGIPPGFELLTEDLQTTVEKTVGNGSGKLEKFSLTATQAILYFNAFAPNKTITVTYRLRAKYPIHAHTFASRVYQYYDPNLNATARPIQLEVHKR